MNEQQFVAQESEKQRRKLVATLKAIQKHGFIKSTHKTDTLLINNLIILSPPRPGFKYNHYKLTQTGLNALQHLD